MDSIVKLSKRKITTDKEHARFILFKLQKLKRKAGCTYKQMSDYTGIPVRTLQQYFCGTLPTAVNIAKMCDYFKVPADWLLSKYNTEEYLDE